MLIDVFGMAMGGLVASAGGKPMSPSGFERALGPFMILFFALCFVVDLGVFRSRRWAFFGLILLSAFELSGHPLHLSARLLLIPGLWTLAYGILRLIPVFGPKLR